MSNNNNLFTSIFGVESEENNNIEVSQESNPSNFVTKESSVSNNDLLTKNFNQIQNNQSDFQITSNDFNETKQINSIETQYIVKPEQTSFEDEIIVLDSNKKEATNQNYQQTINPLPTIENDLNSQTTLNFNDPPTQPKEKSSIVGIFLIVFLAGTGILFCANALFDQPSSPQKQTSNIPTTEIITKEDPKESEEDNPTKPVVTSFDTTFEFNKGYTTNSNELYQTVAYKPTSSEGVIKCENIKSINQYGISAKGTTYIYYKDFMSKKIIATSEYKLDSTNTYNEMLKTLNDLKNVTKDYKNIEINIDTNKSKLSIKANILVDLVYGHAFRFEDNNQLLKIVVSYNMQIQSAMENVLTKEGNIGNTHCSTIITN